MKFDVLVIVSLTFLWTGGASSQQLLIDITISTTLNPNCTGSQLSTYQYQYVCGSLMEGLSKVKEFPIQATFTFHLNGQSHHVSNINNRLVFPGISEVNFFSIYGAEIMCDHGSGWYFYDVSNLNIHNVTFINCTEKRNTTYRNQGTDSANIILVALLFSNITNLNMFNLEIPVLDGIAAVALYNVNSATIKKCTLKSSTMTEQWVASEYSVTSTLILQLTFCNDFDKLDEGCTRNSRTGSQVIITDCIISDNYATTSEQGYFNLKSSGNHYNLVGKGGGIAIVVKGYCYNNVFIINSTNITGNMANQGSGLYIAFMDGTYQNKVTINNSSFTNNGKLKVTPGNLTYLYNAGGGINIDNWVFPSVSNGPNQVTIRNSSFSHNEAYLGGGVFLNSVHSNAVKTLTVLIRQCNFTENKAKIGSAMYIMQSNATSFDDSVNVTVQNTNFTKNFIINLRDISSAGYGAVYSHLVGLKFSDVKFCGNNASALVVINSYTRFAGSSAFNSNTGLQGGAIALLGSSYIFISPGTSLYFCNNTAAYKGGAIYKLYPEHIVYGPHFTPCFVQHQDSINVTFSNNKLQNGNHNSIHATSVIPCGIETITLFGPGWSYDGDKSSQITTDFASYKALEINHPRKISPGRRFNISFDIIDDLDHNSTMSNQTFIVHKEPTESGNPGAYVTTIDQLNIYGEVNESFLLVLDSIETPTLHVQFDVKLSECPLGFIQNGTKCVCSSNYEFKGFVNCTESDRHIAILDDNGWIGLHENKTVVATCPLFYCKTKRGGLELPKYYTEDLGSSICAGNRRGLLCSECIEDYLPTVNSWKLNCVNCMHTNALNALLTFLSAVYIPYALMMTIIILFNLRLSSGPASTLVMYSQMVTTTFDASIHGLIDSYPERALNSYRYIYGLLNLDFIDNIFPQLCFQFQHTILASFGFNFLLVVIPMTVIAAVMLLIAIVKKYKLTFKPIERFWNVLKDRNLFKFSPRNYVEALVLAITTVITLSFLKICISSAFILSTTPLIEINNTTTKQRFVTFAADIQIESLNYRVYQAPAVLSEILAIVFIILLLDFPLRLIEYFIHRSNFLSKVYPEVIVHSFMSAFNGLYKKQFRIFAGLSFLMRYCFSLVFVNPTKNFTKFTLQSMSCFLMVLLIFFCWPYKNVKHNYIDLFILSNLLILNGLGFYQYVNYFISPVTSKRVTLFIFSIQYIFTVTPLICLACYCIYRLTRHKHEEWREDFQSTMSGLVKKWSPALHEKIYECNHGEDEGLENHVSSNDRISINRQSQPTARGLLRGQTSLNSSASDDVEIDRARDVPVTVIGVTDKHEGEATTYQTSQSEGYFLRSDWNPVSYGSTSSYSNKEKKRKARK